MAQTDAGKPHSLIRAERLFAVLLALALWQLGAMFLGNSLLLVTPVQVAVRLFELLQEPDFYAVTGFSFARIVSGFLLGFVSGTLLAMLAGRWHWVEVLLWPYITVIKTTPVASFIILCLIWLDSSNLSVFIAFLMVLPIVYSNMLEGIKAADGKLIEMAKLFHVSYGQRLLYVYLPQIKPYLLSACSIGLGLSWKAGIAAEVIGIPDGSIGERLYEAKVYLSSADLFAWTVVVILISVLFEKLVMLLLKKSYQRLERS